MKKNLSDKNGADRPPIDGNSAEARLLGHAARAMGVAEVELQREYTALAGEVIPGAIFDLSLVIEGSRARMRVLRVGLESLLLAAMERAAEGSDGTELAGMLRAVQAGGSSASSGGSKPPKTDDLGEDLVAGAGSR